MNVKLRAAREKARLTQAQLAEKTGISELSYQRYEYDDRQPSVRTAIRIAYVLSTTVENLFTQ